VLGIKTPTWWSYRVQKEVWRYLQPSGYNEPTRVRRTDDTGRQQRSRLRMRCLCNIMRSQQIQDGCRAPFWK